MFIYLVATVLTACGIETIDRTVFFATVSVATVLTACGIETRAKIFATTAERRSVATVLTACGIETHALKISSYLLPYIRPSRVATVLTACGIETRLIGCR